MLPGSDILPVSVTRQDSFLYLVYTFMIILLDSVVLQGSDILSGSFYIWYIHLSYFASLSYNARFYIRYIHL